MCITTVDADPNSMSEHENGNENEAIINILNGDETGDVDEQERSKNQNST